MRSVFKDCSRMRGRNVRAILSIRASTTLSHDPCLGMSTYLDGWEPCTSLSSAIARVGKSKSSSVRGPEAESIARLL